MSVVDWRAVAMRLRQVLDEMQWQGCREDGEPACPNCYGQPWNGHLTNCPIGAALAETPATEHTQPSEQTHRQTGP